MMVLRAAGVVLVALSVLPLYRLLGPETGLAGAATTRMAGTHSTFAFAGALLFAIPGIIAARAGLPTRAFAAAESALLRPPVLWFAFGLALIAGSAAAAFSTFVLDRQPNLVDAMAQLQHARYLAAGHAAGPITNWHEFWHIQQSVVTPAGWVSHYPPGHVALLAIGLRFGAAWLVGPVLLSATVFLTALTAERLLAHDRLAARLGALFAAVSPFLIAHAGAYMSHTSAALFAVLAVYCALRAHQSRGWAAALGVALGALWATRPLTAAALATVIVAFVWFELRAHTSRTVRGHFFALAAGALPFTAAVAWYNVHFFGGPLTFGYNITLGPAGSLGLGVDPWGNTYGLLEAVAYTSAELVALSTSLLETPLPLVALIGGHLLFVRAATRREKMLVAWACVPLAAHLLYWHHGLFMGPRMLNEWAPAWCILLALSLLSLVRRLPDALPALPQYSPRRFATASLTLALIAGTFVLTPRRLGGYTMRAVDADAVQAPAGAPLLVFVHGSWSARLSMRLAAAGMRLDSVESALRQNPTCLVQQYADARAGRDTVPQLDLTRRATDLPPQLLLTSGNSVRARPGEYWPPVCAREAAADRYGVLDVSPLLWQSDLPGIESGRVMFVRDMGPAANEKVLRAQPGRVAAVLMTPVPDGEPVLVPYARAMTALWGDDATLAAAMPLTNGP